MTYTFKIARRTAQNHLAATALTLLLAACGATAPTDATPTPVAPVAPAPVAGWLTLQLDTPNADDGAVQFFVTGPAIEEVAPATGLDGVATITNGAAHLVVTGQVGDGAVARIRVPDLAKATQYQVQVTAAAARGTYELRQVAAYRVTVAR